MSEEQNKHLVIGTAGHIDHGKTSLIKALTGRDLDSLAEEKERGITIELGFAFLNENIAFVDVPGHERLVKTMVAGASAMGAAMLIVAADDGIMPQTKEHLIVLDALGISKGIVVITKADLVDEEWIELVNEELRELVDNSSLKGSKILVVDSLSGRGIEELRNELFDLYESYENVENPGFFRMPVDRSFLIKGYGRVVTGTVWSGSTKKNDKLQLLPGNNEVRVRGIEAHEKEVKEIYYGHRAALNLVTDAEPERGQVLLSKGRAVETDFFDAFISLLPESRQIKHRTRIRLHIGTAEIIGRIMIVGADFILPGENGIARVALESPIVAMVGDRAVIRLYSPMETLGGLEILDPQPPDKRRTIKGLEERLNLLNGEDSQGVYGIIKSRIVLEKEYLISLFPWSWRPLFSVSRWEALRFHR